jgi:hypothetical protein
LSGVRDDVLAAGVEDEVDLVGEVSLQAADDLHFGVPLAGPFRDVGLCSRVEPDPADDREVQVRGWIGGRRRG